MSMPTEAVEALHEATAALKKEHVSRIAMLQLFDDPNSDTVSIILSRAEAEQIVSQRIAGHENRLKELGWTRIIRVDEANPIQQPKRLDGTNGG